MISLDLNFQWMCMGYFYLLVLSQDNFRGFPGVYQNLTSMLWKMTAGI